jgi:hypothetical protein
MLQLITVMIWNDDDNDLHDGQALKKYGGGLFGAYLVAPQSPMGELRSCEYVHRDQVAHARSESESGEQSTCLTV